MGRIIPHIMENKQWLKPPTRYKSKQTWRTSKSNHLLVVYLPLWKIWVRQLGCWNSQDMEIHKIHVPKHQPDVNLIMLVLWPVVNMNQHGTALWPGGKIISCAAGLGCCCCFNSKDSFLAPLFLGWSSNLKSWYASNSCGMFCGFAMFYDVFEEGFGAWDTQPPDP